MPPTHRIGVNRTPLTKANPPAKPPLAQRGWGGLLRHIRVYARGATIVGVVALATGCGPRAHVPQRPVPVPDAIAATDSQARTARALAPVLYLQRDEWFPLTRVVAAIHPTRPIIAYYLLWRDDVNGAWIPFTVPTDEEVVWVEHDGQGKATKLWSYWHGKTLEYAMKDGDSSAFNVQWGKHGSIPRGMGYGELPGIRKLNEFYLSTILGLPDIWLGNSQRKGPWCFCHSFKRYREFTREMPLADRLDAIVVTEHPGPVLAAVFGSNYSKKRMWPWKKH